MALINRLGRIFKADFNAVLDQIEEPELLLKQAIRDMEDELLTQEQRVADLAKHSEQLQGRSQEIQKLIADHEEQVALCFAEENVELVRPILRKKLVAERLAKKLEIQSEQQQMLLADERKLLEENHQVLEGLRQKAELMPRKSIAESRASQCDDLQWIGRDLEVDDADVEIAFLRETAARGAV